MRSRFVQAICHICWNARHPENPSSGTSVGPAEVCAYCGKATASGIYVREDPATVPYPRPA